jgi:hypothetical protein
VNDLWRKKISFKTRMKRCNGSGRAERKRKRVPDGWSSKEKRSLTLSRFYERNNQQVGIR